MRIEPRAYSQYLRNATRLGTIITAVFISMLIIRNYGFISAYLISVVLPGLWDVVKDAVNNLNHFALLPIIKIQLLSLFIILLIDWFMHGWKKSALFRSFSLKDKNARTDTTLFFLYILGLTQIMLVFFTFGLWLLFTKLCTTFAIHFFGGHFPLRTSSLILDGVIFLLISSLSDYVAHRIAHTKYFWSVHRLHHSATELNGFTSYRAHPLDTVLFLALPIFFFTFLPAPPVCIMFLNVIHILQHTDLNWTFGWFGTRVVASPAYHKIHHSIKPEHIDKNFCNTLTIWDHVFGTYVNPGDTRNLTLGLVQPEENMNDRFLLVELLIDFKTFIVQPLKEVFKKIRTLS